MRNLTPHSIHVAVDGEIRVFPPSGEIARVSTVEQVIGEFTGLPEEGEPCLVSAIVLEAVKGRKGVYAPDSGPTAVRNEKGHIVHVTRLVAA